MQKSYFTQDDIKVVLAEVFSPEDVALIMCSPVRPDLKAFEILYYKDHLFRGGPKVIAEEVALSRTFVETGIFSLAAAFPH